MASARSDSVIGRVVVRVVSVHRGAPSRSRVVSGSTGGSVVVAAGEVDRLSHRNFAIVCFSDAFFAQLGVLEVASLLESLMILALVSSHAAPDDEHDNEQEADGRRNDRGHGNVGLRLRLLLLICATDRSIRQPLLALVGISIVDAHLHPDVLGLDVARAADGRLRREAELAALLSRAAVRLVLALDPFLGRLFLMLLLRLIDLFLGILRLLVQVRVSVVSGRDDRRLRLDCVLVLGLRILLAISFMVEPAHAIHPVEQVVVAHSWPKFLGLHLSYLMGIIMFYRYIY